MEITFMFLVWEKYVILYFFFFMSKFRPKNTGTEGLRLVTLTSIDVVVLYQLSYPMRLIIFNFEFSYTKIIV